MRRVKDKALQILRNSLRPLAHKILLLPVWYSATATGRGEEPISLKKAITTMNSCFQ